MQEKSQGIILRVTRLTDTSSIIRWWTLEHGLVETVAKGARRSSSPFSGKIDLFYRANLTWQRAKSGTLHTLKEIHVENYREGLRRTYTTTLMAAFFCAWIEKISEPEHPDAATFDLLNRGLDHLSEKEPTRRGMHFFERELTRIHGVNDTSAPSVKRLAELFGHLPAMREELLQRLDR